MLIRTHYLYMSKDVNIRGYFYKPKRAHEQKGLRNTSLKELHYFFYLADRSMIRILIVFTHRYPK
jgi:hypothetical protein